MFHGQFDRINSYVKKPSINSPFDKLLFNSSITDLHLKPRINFETNTVIFSQKKRLEIWKKYNLINSYANGSYSLN